MYETKGRPWTATHKQTLGLQIPGLPLILPDYLQRLGHNGDEVLDIGNHGGGAETSPVQKLVYHKLIRRYTGRMVPSGITRKDGVILPVAMV